MAAHGSMRWLETTLGLMYVVDGKVQFVEDYDHWKNGFCRLLEIDEAKARRLVEETVAVAREREGKLLGDLPDEARVSCLALATDRVLYGKARPTQGAALASWGSDFQGAPANVVHAHSISGDASRLVVGNREHELAWLVDAKTQAPVSAESIRYDTTYYASEGPAHYGPKHYTAQVDWRLEKARRLLRTVLDNVGERKAKWQADPKKTRVIDIGSGIGYYRKAFEEQGFDHYGIELSSDIVAAAKQRFGFETWNVELLKLGEVTDHKFDVITLWDVIEHVRDPVASIAYLARFLTPDGVIVVRTPNLRAIEEEILGDFYYSFKFDHIHYFSVRSLDATMKSCGLSPVYTETASHLFKGFHTPTFMLNLGDSMRGADIIGIYGTR